MMDKRIEPAGPSCPRRKDAIGEPLGEDTAAAPHGVAPTDIRHQAHDPSCQRQVGEAALISAMNASTIDCFSIPLRLRNVLKMTTLQLSTKPRRSALLTRQPGYCRLIDTKQGSDGALRVAGCKAL